MGKSQGWVRAKFGCASLTQRTMENEAVLWSWAQSLAAHQEGVLVRKLSRKISLSIANGRGYGTNTQTAREVWAGSSSRIHTTNNLLEMRDGSLAKRERNGGYWDGKLSHETC